MADRSLITPEYLRQRIAYDPATGDLTFLPRPLYDFPCERIWKSWNSWRAGKPAFASKVDHGYYAGRMGGVNLYAHRVAWMIVHGCEPEVIDHLDGNGFNNRLSNLRNCTHAENLTNAKRNKRNQSGATGVHFHDGAWIAKLGRQRLGRFSTKEEAMAARHNATAGAGLITDRNATLG